MISPIINNNTIMQATINLFRDLLSAGFGVSWQSHRTDSGSSNTLCPLPRLLTLDAPFSPVVLEIGLAISGATSSALLLSSSSEDAGAWSIGVWMGSFATPRIVNSERCGGATLGFLEAMMFDAVVEIMLDEVKPLTGDEPTLDISKCCH